MDSSFFSLSDFLIESKLISYKAPEHIHTLKTSKRICNVSLTNCHLIQFQIFCSGINPEMFCVYGEAGKENPVPTPHFSA